MTDDARRGLSPDVEMEDDPSLQRKGRGFDPRNHGDGGTRSTADGVKHKGAFDVLDSAVAVGEEQHAARSIEGYIVIVTGIDEEATEEEVVEKFADYGRVQNCHLNLDRRTGYVKGYALLEYERIEEAQQAIDACREGEATLMDKKLKADFAFVQPPASSTKTAVSSRRDRHRSRSPARR